MKTVLYIVICAFLMLPCLAQGLINSDVVEDYIDMANLYQSSHNYYKALEYIEMIEPHDEYNAKIKYQKVYLLKNLNEMEAAKKIMDKLVTLNQDYACSDLAKIFYKDEMNSFCCAHN